MRLPNFTSQRQVLSRLVQRLPHGTSGLVGSALIGGAVLTSLSALHLFEPRITKAPEPEAPPSPFIVKRANAIDDGACQLSVRVRADGDARDDAKVEFVRIDAGTVQERLTALTDRAGTHRLIDLVPGAYDVTVDVPGFTHNGASTFFCDASTGGRRAFLDIDVVKASDELTGVIIGRRGKPLSSAEIALWQDDNARLGLTGVIRVRTDDAGRFTARLLPGHYRGYVSADEHVGKKVAFVVKANERAEVKVGLVWSPAVRGVVIDELGAPIVNASVAVGNAFNPRALTTIVTTDAHGRFALPVQHGQELTITARGNGRVARAFVGVVDNIDRFQNVQLIATAGRTVSGVVFRTSGEPLAFGAVHYRIKSLGLEGEAPTDGKGRFSLDGMPSDADVEVWAAGNATGAWGAQVATPSTSQLALTYVAPAW